MEEKREATHEIKLKRCHMTLSFDGGFAVYSPKAGVMSAKYPKYYFSEADFKEKIGSGADGATITYQVLSTDRHTHSPQDPSLPQPEGGFQHSDTMCKIVNVVLSE